MARPVAAKERSEADARKLADHALERAIIIDTHADTPQMMLDEGYDLADRSSPYMVSIPKMRDGHLGAEFFSIWVSVDWPPEHLIHRALDLIDVVDDEVARHSDALELALTADDVARIHRQKKIAVLMGVEGGHIIEDDLRALDVFYRLGVRYMTLTHTKNTQWADSSGDKPQWNGLTDFGRAVVERMNRLGMMVDISHVSDKTFYDALAATKAPVIASHSSCRALCDRPRNMTDDMIRALAQNGGVMDINFYSAFVDQTFADAYKTVSAPMDAEVEAERERLKKEGKHLSYAEETRIRQKYEASLPTPSFERIADHIDHAVKVGGVDHVGLGSDFDGVDSIPRGMEDATKIPNLVRELARRGYSESDLEKILGGNVLRVMRQVEAASRQMQSAESGGDAGGPVAEKVYSVGRDVAPPQVTYNPQPTPPEQTNKAKREATLRASIVVDSKGNVRDVHVIKPVGLGLDEKAVDVIHTWKFKPATRNGRPVAARLIVEIKYRLVDQKKQGDVSSGKH